VFSLQAFAAAQSGGRDFNHMTTGFPLSGGHAIAACETCHTGGVFKGTPRNCDGCHATGKRIVATPKSTSHIVTDAPCENCHFNSATWLGARFNHGAAQTGKCASCHNGRISTGKPASHSIGNKATKSCDSCHRSSAWTPVSWNHTGVVGACSTCHGIPGSLDVTAPNRMNATTHPGSMFKGTLGCESCHFYTAWSPNRFKHNVAGTCASCHDTTQVDVANRKPASHPLTSFKGTLACDSCHYTSAWTPNTFKHNVAGTCASCHATTQVDLANRKPASHLAPALKGTLACDSCHYTSAWTPNTFKHNVAGRCDSCHDGVLAVGPNHYRTHPVTIGTSDCSECHINTTHSWTPALGAKPANHIPYTAGTSCTACHVSVTSVRTGAAMHAYTSGISCTTCHLRNNQYVGWGQDTKSIGHEGMQSGDDCSKSGCHAPLGRKGTAYVNWD
jgi:hypothetical protein